MTRAQGNLAKRQAAAKEAKEAEYKKYKIKEGGAFSRDEKLALAKKNELRKTNPEEYKKRKAAHNAAQDKARKKHVTDKHDAFQKKHKRGKYSDKNVAKAAEKEKTRKSELNIFQRIGEWNANQNKKGALRRSKSIRNRNKKK